MVVSGHVEQVGPAVVQAVTIAMVHYVTLRRVGDEPVHGQVYLIIAVADCGLGIPAAVGLNCSPFVLG